MNAASLLPPMTAEELAPILAAHKLWLDTRWDDEPQGARAVLDGRNLNRASLNGASLDGASLDGASLDGASLDGASLDGASLNGASLDDASLNGASLNDATALPGGFSYREYVEEVVPALCVAGGKSLNDVANKEVWNCHSWSNCPMHRAFDADGLHSVPALYRPMANFFVQMFDAKLIPLARVNPAAVTGTAPACTT